mmetsp:Transcript_25946/g.48715  ORF Transcript_25946/g.48715 Transcript_25946/m.48715 type:complete len:1387 (+) Transcript_25946:144-4304(+)
MDYEKFFEDDLDDISDCDDEGEQFQHEKDEFVAASIAQLKLELSVPIGVTGGASVSGGVLTGSSEGKDALSTESDVWKELMASVQKTNQQLEHVSSTIDSHVEITPRPDESEVISRRNQLEVMSAPRPSPLVTVSIQQQVQNGEEEAAREDIRDMLFEMVVSVEYIMSLAQDTTQESRELDVAPLATSTLLDVPLEIEFQEPVMELQEPQQELLLNEAAAEDLFVYDGLVDVDSSHKRKFEIAMSDTEKAMREKEEEYKRAIEEDRLRREERRARKRALALELARTRAATLIQSQCRRRQCRHVLSDARKEQEIQRQAVEAARAAVEIERKRMERAAEVENRDLMEREDQAGAMLRALRELEDEEERERRRVEAERAALAAEEEECRKREAEEEERRKREAEEARRREEEAERERVAKIEKEAAEKAEKERIKAAKAAEKVAKEKKAAAAAAHQKTLKENKDSKGTKPSWGGFIQKTLFGTKKETESEEKALVEIEYPVPDESNYDEYFVYSDEEDGGGSEEQKNAARDTSSNSEESTVMGGLSLVKEPPLDLVSSSASKPSVDHIEQAVMAALSRAQKVVEFTQAVVPSAELDPSDWERGEFSVCKPPSWLLVSVFQQWQHSPAADIFKSVVQENSPVKQEPARKLDLSVESLKDIQFLQKHPNLESLDLNVNSISSLDGIGQHASNLLELSMKDNKLRCAEGLKDLLNLRVLRLDTNQLENLTSLEGLTELTEVSVNMNNLTSLPKLSSTALQKLELYRNQITCLEDTHLQALTSLTHLDLGRNKLTYVSGQALSQCPLLSQLILSQNKLTEVPSPLYLPNLRSLWLSGNKLRNLDVWAPAKGEAESSSWPVFLPLLEKLYLQDNQVESFAAYTLATSPFLMEIDLSFNSISAFSNLAGLVFCQQLKVLQLQDNPVDKERGMTFLLHYFLPNAKEISGQTVSAAAAPKFSTIKPFILSAGDEVAARLLEAEVDVLRRQAAGESHCHADIRGGRGALEFEDMMVKAARSVLCSCCQFSPQICHAKTSDTDRGLLLMTLGRMSSEHGLVRSKEQVEVTSTDEEGLLQSRIDSSLFQLFRSHLKQLLYWTPAQCERVQSYQTTSHLEHVPHRRRRASMRRRGGTKEALWRQEARKGHAALRLQACARGFLLRRKMKHALSGARYEDDELEAMMRDQDGLMAEYGSILNDDAPEFSDGWLQTRRPPSVPGNKQYTSDDPTGSDDGGGASSSIVYGDHKRRRRVTPDSQQLQQQPLEPFSPDHNIETSSRSPRPTQQFNMMSGTGGIGASRNITSKVNEWVSGDDFSLQNDVSSRPSRSTPPLSLNEVDSGVFHEIPLSAASSSRGFQDSRPASRSSNLSAASTPNSRFGKYYHVCELLYPFNYFTLSN